MSNSRDNRRPEQIRPSRLLIAFWALAFVIVLLFSQEFSSAVRLRVENEAVAETLVQAAGVLDRVSSYTGLKHLKVQLWNAREAVNDTAITVGTVRSLEPDRPSFRPAADPVNEAPAAPDLPARKAVRRILLVGSSSIQFGLGRSLERRLEGFEGVEVLRFGRYSTGLARPDYFDWIEKAEELTSGFKPDMVISQIGGNDCQSLTDHEGQLMARFGTDEWDEAYSSRLTKLLEILQVEGAEIVLLGLPIMRSSGFRKRVARLNSITENIASGLDADFISLWKLTENSEGGYRSELKVGDRVRSLRADDGVHLSLFGSNYVAGRIVEYLQARFGFEKKEEEEGLKEEG